VKKGQNPRYGIENGRKEEKEEAEAARWEGTEKE